MSKLQVEFVRIDYNEKSINKLMSQSILILDEYSIILVGINDLLL